MQTSSDGVAVSIRGVSKVYRLGETAAYAALRDKLTTAMRSMFRPAARPVYDDLWALRDVSVDFAAGEVWGLIGSNGAGKSTLLKILSRITEPTEGEVHLFGRVSTLLEVGTGFHPELTGRENIYLNGSILGMSRKEIRTKFDDIVAFSEVERFLDTPVKRYSSGMYVRLAFAVAAHLDPEILLVDEVLAVGDASFQRKCLGKMHDISRTGRTVVFVSHNMTAVNQLCDKAVWLDGGEIRSVGPASRVIGEYLSAGRESDLEWIAPKVFGDGVAVERAVLEHSATGIYRADEQIVIAFDVDAPAVALPSHISMYVQTEDGMAVIVSVSTDGHRQMNEPFPAGRHRLRCTIPGNLLRPGRYVITVWLPSNHAHMQFESILSFVVSEENCRAHGARFALVAPVLEWTSTPL